MSNRLVLVCLVALAFAGFGNVANAATMTPAAFLKAVNTNADKTISKEELDTYAKKRFAELNTDHDKTLSAKELKGRLSAGDMAMADKDKDKTVDEAEFVGYADGLFDQANTKGDKTLSVKELTTPAGKKLIKLLQ